MARILRFSKTLGEVKRRLEEKYPEAIPVEGATNDVNHTLWMIGEVKKLVSQRKVYAWYNWIICKAHSPLGLFDAGDDYLTEIRNMARRDAKSLTKSERGFILAIIDFEMLGKLR